jgi:hypothetical protein
LRNVRLKRATECAVFLFKGDAQMEILARRFGKKIKLPPTVQIKREILLRWLADQTEIEAAEVRKDRFEKQPGVGMLKGGAKADQ